MWGGQRYGRPVRSPLTVQTELPRRPKRAFLVMLLLRAYERERNSFVNGRDCLFHVHLAGKKVRGIGRTEITCAYVLYMLKVVNNTTRYKKNVYSRY